MQIRGAPRGHLERRKKGRPSRRHVVMRLAETKFSCPAGKGSQQRLPAPKATEARCPSRPFPFSISLPSPPPLPSSGACPLVARCVHTNLAAGISVLGSSRKGIYLTCALQSPLSCAPWLRFLPVQVKPELLTSRLLDFSHRQTHSIQSPPRHPPPDTAPSHRLYPYTHHVEPPVVWPWRRRQHSRQQQEHSPPARGSPNAHAQDCCRYNGSWRQRQHGQELGPR